MKKTLILILLISQTIGSQTQSNITDQLIGYWEGAFIKTNSYQKIEVQFTNKGGKIFALQIMDEWHPTFGEFEVPVQIDSTNQISFGTGYGKAELKLDNNNLEIFGQLVGLTPSIYLHLKKAADRPAPNYTIEEVKVNSEKNELYGHLHVPYSNPMKTAVIIVGGRGCNADQTKFNLYAKFLRKYGVATLAYQKRGTGNSTGNCESATINDFANDLKEIKLFLETRKEGFKKIGVLGISAGGWVMTKAEEITNFDFMMSVVGPSTSVRSQQMQSMLYGAEFYKLNKKAQDELKQYTNLMFDAKPSEKDFKSMQDLLESSENNGWRKLLENTDIPNSVPEIGKLWVRRHNYDPKNELIKFKKPFLAVYGERDWIVPQKENINLLHKYFSDNINNLTTVNAHNAEHGMEMEAKWIDVDQNKSYWHFYRISPEVRITMVDFLKKHSLIK